LQVASVGKKIGSRKPELISYASYLARDWCDGDVSPRLREFAATVIAVAKRASGGDNLAMPKNVVEEGDSFYGQAPNRRPFLPGSMVIVTLSNPREKFWGMILALSTEGVSLSGVDLGSFEDLALMVKDGEKFATPVVLFPMHRVERIELDLPDGDLPSLAQRFLAKTGIEPADLMQFPRGDQRTRGTSKPSSSAQADEEPA
jgi:hypothetical protein